MAMFGNLELQVRSINYREGLLISFANHPPSIHVPAQSCQSPSQEHSNFKNIGFAMLTLFRASTGEDWQELLVLCYKGDFTWVGAVAYWFSFIGLTLFVTMNMFVMVIANYFEQAENSLDEYILLRNFRRVRACE